MLSIYLGSINNLQSPFSFCQSFAPSFLGLPFLRHLFSITCCGKSDRSSFLFPFSLFSECNGYPVTQPFGHDMADILASVVTLLEPSTFDSPKQPFSSYVSYLPISSFGLEACSGF